MNQEKPRYNHQQASGEADAIKGSLIEFHPEQGGVYSTAQYAEAAKRESNDIYQSAATIRELAKNTNIPFAKEAYEALGGDGVWENLFSGMPHLVEMRYLASEKLITDLIASGKVSQVVELASGLTPHAVSLSKKSPGLKKYVEVDYRVNILRKKEMNEALGITKNVEYVSGDLFDPLTWDKIDNNLGEGNAIIFSEGFMLYMKDAAERSKLANNVRRVLEKRGGYFVFDDSLRYHPEFQTDPLIKDFLGTLIKGETIGQEELTKEWEERGFVVERVPEDSDLSCERTLPDKQQEINLLKSHFKLWKLSLSK